MQKTTTPSGRLYSLDALRGFDMFWIMGAESIFHELYKVTGSPFWGAVSAELTHPDWNGFTFYDVIFPLFLFIAGVATPYSTGRELEKGKTKADVTWRVIKRGLILTLLGIIYNNGLELRPLSEIRFGSVLGRIGLAYMFANIIYIWSSKFKTLVIWFCSILATYWLFLKFTAAPGFPAGTLTMEGNTTSYIDRVLMPGHLYKEIHDPEGLASTFPAIATGLLGIMTGMFLKDNQMEKAKKALWMGITGLVFIALAHLWNLDFPINKNLWTSSFVLNAGGYSLVLLAIFFYIIDVLGYQKWAFFFKVIGMNSIVTYMSDTFINWHYTNNALFKWLDQLTGSPYNVVVMAVCYVLVQWMFLYFLYKKKVFLRV